MRAVLQLEVIGEPYHWLRRNRHKGQTQRVFSMREEINIIRYGQKRYRPWVARISSIHGDGTLGREFITGMRDWTHARRSGMRGVYEYFALRPGVYEVNECVRLGKARRYFIHVEGTEYHEITREEVEQCLNED